MYYSWPLHKKKKKENSESKIFRNAYGHDAEISELCIVSLILTQGQSYNTTHQNHLKNNNNNNNNSHATEVFAIEMDASWRLMEWAFINVRRHLSCSVMNVKY